ncbi:MAG: V-type ATP synthase subunit E [Clostridia bacterium]|nr:V-type ATP synthase subunit E [Clostridia bacterium]
MTGLDKITGKIISEAEKDASAMLERARERCAEIMFEAQREAESIKAALEEEAQREAESIIAKAKSEAAMQKRNLLLSARSEAVDRVFAQAYKEILNLPEEKYCELVSRLIAEAMIEELENEKNNIFLYGEENIDLPEKYELIFNKNDKEKLGTAILSGVERVIIGKLNREELEKLVIADECADIDGGVIVRFGSIEYNCSVSSVFSAIRARMESEISTHIFSSQENK